MFNCQFCGFDYSEQGLREGRCPSCGVLLAWQDESQPSDDRISDSELPVAPADAVAPQSPPPSPAPAPARAEPQPPPPQPARQDLAASESPASESPASEPAPQAAAPQTPESELPPSFSPPAPESPPPPTPDGPMQVVGGQTIQRDIDPSQFLSRESTEDPEKYSKLVEQIWSKSITSPNKHSTIQTPSMYGTVSNLVIRTRSLSQGQTTQHQDPVDYELLGVIGEGGVGVVYSARQASINRTVAVKMLRTKEQELNDKGKFLAEAVVTGELDHPNIVPIYDLGSNEEGSLFYSMKQVQGTPWSEVIFNKSLGENIEILMKVGDAVAFAHARGVVHRDLKPENVMLGEFGEVLVMDWGMALSTSMQSDLATAEPSAGMGGTPAYMSPEMATGPLSKIGPASDVYLLGAILYEAITGRPPHRGKTVMDCLANAAVNNIIPTHRTGELLEIAFKAMSTEPEARYPNVKEFQQAIREYESHLESTALVQRGTAALAQAETTQDYKEFSRSIVAYEEALALWEDNDGAVRGLDDAIQSYAGAALTKGDFELGLSLLNEDKEAHRPTIVKLRRGLVEREARQQRIANLRRTAIALVTVMLIGASGASGICYKLYLDAVESADIAEEERSKASKSAVAAVNQKKLALAAKDEANTFRDQAETSLTTSLISAASETELSYRSSIQLINARINDNAFLRASSLLDKQENEIQKKLRHWEWGRLRQLCDLAATSLTNAKGEESSPVMAVAATADGSMLAVGHANGFIRLWSHTDASWRKLTAHRVDEGGVSALAFSPNGDLLACGVRSSRNPIQLFRIANGDLQLERELSGHRGAVNSLQFSREGNRLLSSSDDETGRLWFLPSAAEPTVFYGHFDAVRSLQYSHDETLVVSASDDGSVRVWKADTGTEVASFRQHAGKVLSAIFLSPTAAGDYVVATGGSDGKIFLWTPKLIPAVMAAKTSAEAKIAFEKSQVSLVKAMYEKGPTAAPVAKAVPISAHSGRVRTLALVAGGDLLVSGGDDATLRVWDPRTLMANSFTAHPKMPALREQLRDRADGDDLRRGLLLTLRGHGGWISSTESLGKNARLISGSYDGSARVWSLADYEELEVHRFGERNPVISSAQSRDGRWLAAALEDGTARVWDDAAQTIQIPPLTEGHDYLTNRAVLDSSGGRLYTAAGDNTVRTWNFASGGQLRKLSNTGPEGVLAVSQNGKWLVTGSDGQGAKLWNEEYKPVELDHAKSKRFAIVDTDVSEDVIRNRVKRITAAAIAGNETVFAADASGGVWLWSIANPEQEPKFRQLHGGRINVAHFIQGGRLITASSDYNVAIWDTRSSGPGSIMRLRHDGPVTVLSVSQDETRIATASVLRRQSGQTVAQLRLFKVGVETPDRRLQLRLEEGREVQRVNSIAFAPDKASAIISISVTRSDASDSRDHLYRWDFNSNRLEEEWKDRIYRGAISTVMVTADKSVLTVGGRGGVLWTPTGGIQKTFQPHSSVNSIRFSPDSRMVVTTGSDGIAKVWLLQGETTHVVAKLETPNANGELGGHDGEVTFATFHPTANDIVATAGVDETVRLWRFSEATGDAQVIAVYGGEDGHSELVHQAAFSNDGRMLVTASADGTARVWDVSSPGKPIAELSHGARVLCCQFSSDDRWVGTGADDGTTRVWDVQAAVGNDAPEPLLKLEGHSAAVTAVDFSHDRQRLLTGSRDRSAMLWDITQLRKAGGKLDIDSEILLLDHHAGELTGAAFSPDGRAVLTSALDGVVALARSTEVSPSVLLSVGSPMKCEGDWVQVDKAAIIRQPNRNVDDGYFDGYRLAVNVVKPIAGDELAVKGKLSEAIRIEGEDIYFDNGESPVATIVSSSNSSLALHLNAKASAAAIEAMIHCLAYRNAEIKSEDNRKVRIHLLDKNGVSGNFEDAENENVRKIRLIAPPPPEEEDLDLEITEEETATATS